MAYVKRKRTKAGESRYEVRYRTPDGSERSKTFPTRKTAERFAAQAHVDVGRGQWVDPRAGRVTVSVYATQWLAQRPSLKPRTRETYEDQLRLHIKPALGDTELSKLTPAAVRAWHSSLVTGGLSHNTAAKCYRLLRTILGTAVDDELLVRNPCTLKGASVERVAERPVATVEQVWAAAEAMPERYRCLVLVAGFAGLRVGELLGLECRHVDVLHGTLRVEQQEQQLRGAILVVSKPKTEAGIRTLALPPFLVTEIEQHLSRFTPGGPTDRLFTGDKGGSLRRQVLHGHWSDARAAAGCPRSSGSTTCGTPRTRSQRRVGRVQPS